MAEAVHSTGQKQREAAEKASLDIPAVNYRNEPLSGGPPVGEFGSIKP